MEREGSGAIQIVLRLNGSLSNLLTAVSSGVLDPYIPPLGSKSIRLVLWFRPVSPWSSAVFLFSIFLFQFHFLQLSACASIIYDRAKPSSQDSCPILLS